MTEIPLIILFTVIGVIAVLSVVAFIFRSRFPPSMLLFLCGGILLLLFLTTDKITVDREIQNVTKSGDTHTINYGDNNFDLKMVSGEPTFVGIMFVLMSLMFIIVGGLVEFGNR
jgi:hypothetical protein